MRRIEHSDLELGQPLRADVCDSKGRVLFSRGQVIQPADLEEYWQDVRRGLFINDSPNELSIGERLSHNIYDQYGVLLLARGSLVTAAFLEQLRARGQWKADPPPEDEKTQLPPEITLQTPATRRLDESVEKQTGGDYTPKYHWPEARMSLNQFRQASAEAVQQFDQLLDQYHGFGAKLARGGNLRSRQPREHIQTLMELFRSDRNLPLMLLNLRDMDKDYLFAHGIKVSLLSMSIAISLGYNEQDVADVGLGALLQDIGMLRVPEEIRMAPRALTDSEWLEIQHHPIYTADLLDAIGVKSPLTMLVGYQAHERCDRSGYPRRRPRALIHPLSRVVAVADTYIALTSPRPHRQAFSPYDSNITLLHEANAGRLDHTAVRALLDCISLFPVGSGVVLSNQLKAKVIRSNPGHHTEPVVVPLNDDGSESDRELDLAGRDDLKIVDVFELPPTSTQPLEVELVPGD